MKREFSQTTGKCFTVQISGNDRDEYKFNSGENYEETEFW
jgi:hypothetical protein